MESLYTKYRPQTFEQVVGQKHVVGTLERAVLEQKLSHAYLFCGPRGTGKTTMARLLAKAILCHEAPGHLPDGTCEDCQLIAAGQHPDVFEIDAASNTGVDNVREEIISRASYAPVRGKGKVYIIDEVHMLTSAAFNALLKTLEEPPSHVTFIMCTTDPQKILATILSRVQRFDFRSIAAEEMAEHLVNVCKNEGFTYEDAAIDLIVIDSVAALVPKAEIQGDMGDSHVGLQARLMSQALRKIAGTVNKTNTCVIFINQLREKSGVMFGNPETTTGGRALKFYASIRMDVRKADVIKQGGEVIGNRTKIKVVKNKIAPPFKEAQFDIMFGQGISRTGDVLDIAVDDNIVVKSGAWFSYNGEKIGQGRENVKIYLDSNPSVFEEIEKKVKEIDSDN